MRREHRSRAWLAWHFAMLGRVKKMPTLNEMVGGEAKPQPQTWQEMRANLRLHMIVAGQANA